MCVGGKGEFEYPSDNNVRVFNLFTSTGDLCWGDIKTCEQRHNHLPIHKCGQVKEICACPFFLLYRCIYIGKEVGRFGKGKEKSSRRGRFIRSPGKFRPCSLVPGTTTASIIKDSFFQMNGEVPSFHFVCSRRIVLFFLVELL